jgi:hypothetical protein
MDTLPFLTKGLDLADQGAFDPAEIRSGETETAPQGRRVGKLKHRFGARA